MKNVLPLAFFCFLVAFTCPLSAQSESAPLSNERYITADNRYIEIVGTEPIAVQAVNRISLMTGDEFYRIFRNPGGRKVLVNLVPSSGEESVTTVIDRYNSVNVTIRYSGEVPVPMMVRAIVQGLLTKSVQSRFDRNTVSRIPVWIELAMTDYIRTRFNPAWEDDLVRQAGRHPLMAIREILATERGSAYGVHVRANAYWLFTSLKEAAKSRFHFGDGILQLAITENRDALLQTFLGPTAASSSDLSAWWAVQYTAASYRRIAPVDTFEASNEFIESMIRLIVNDGEKDIVLYPIEIRELGRDPLIRDLVQRKLMGIRRHIAKINPVYYNALLSLGQAYEAYLQEDLEAFDQSLILFKRDITNALTTSRLVEAEIY